MAEMKWMEWQPPPPPKKSCLIPFTPFWTILWAIVMQVYCFLYRHVNVVNKCNVKNSGDYSGMFLLFDYCSLYWVIDNASDLVSIPTLAPVSFHSTLVLFPASWLFIDSMCTVQWREALLLSDTHQATTWHPDLSGSSTSCLTGTPLPCNMYWTKI